MIGVKNQEFFYVYVLSYPDGKPFYVGKGKGSRVYHYGGGFSKRVASKITRSGGVVGITMFPCVSEAQAFKREKFLIKFYGRRDIKTGVLCNLSDGGEGPSGVVFGELTLKKISIKSKLMWKDPIYRDVFSTLQKRLWGTSSYREQQKISRAKFWTVEQKKLWSVKMRRVANTPSFRKKSSINSKARWETDRDKMVQAVRNGHKKTSEKFKALWKDPKYRSKMKNSRAGFSAAMKKLWANPKYKSAMRRKAKLGWIKRRTNAGL